MTLLVAHEPQGGPVGEVCLLTVTDALVGEVVRLLSDSGLWVERRSKEGLTSFLVHDGEVRYVPEDDEVSCPRHLQPLMDYLFETDGGDDYIHASDFTLVLDEGRVCLGYGRFPPVVPVVSVARFMDEDDAGDEWMRAYRWEVYE